MRDRPALVAAVVNGLIVLCVPPLLFVVLAMTARDYSDTSTTVRAAGGGSALPELLLFLGYIMGMLGPPATIAGWRTYVHARAFIDGRGTGWRGVAEGGALGFILALAVLGRGIVSRPLEAPPYVLVYGGAALILGLIVGFFLRLSALVVLKLYSPP